MKAVKKETREVTDAVAAGDAAKAAAELASAAKQLDKAAGPRA